MTEQECLRLISKARSLRDLASVMERYDAFLREGEPQDRMPNKSVAPIVKPTMPKGARKDGLHARCPHCRRKFDIQMFNDWIMVPNQPGDPVSRVAHVVYCPAPALLCGKQFKLNPARGWHFERWP